MKKIIIFVCNGNIYRSVIAAEILKYILKENKLDSQFTVDSYGLQGTFGTALPKHKHLSDYPKEWRATKPILKELDIDISKHCSQKITARIAEKTSVIICMDKKIYSEKENSMLKQFPKEIKKIRIISELTSDHKDIEDPSGSSSKKIHKKIIREMYSTLTDTYKTILYWTNSTDNFSKNKSFTNI